MRITRAHYLCALSMRITHAHCHLRTRLRARPPAARDQESYKTPTSSAEKIQLEQHLVRVEDEDLPETDRSDNIDAMLETVPC